jgi:hypothetical protein
MHAGPIANMYCDFERKKKSLFLRNHNMELQDECWKCNEKFTAGIADLRSNFVVNLKIFVDIRQVFMLGYAKDFSSCHRFFLLLLP